MDTKKELISILEDVDGQHKGNKKIVIGDGRTIIIDYDKYAQTILDAGYIRIENVKIDKKEMRIKLKKLLLCLNNYTVDYIVQEICQTEGILRLEDE